MVRSPLHIALFQYDVKWEDPLANRTLIEELQANLNQPSDLLILPEMFTTGFTMNVTSMSETMEGPSVNWLLKSAQKWKCDILGSLIIEADGMYYNRLLWVGPEGLKYTYDKRHLFALAGEDKVFSAGGDITVGEMKGWKIKPLICYDLRFPVWSRTDGTTDIMVFVANFPEKRRFAWRQLLIARAIENQCFVLGLNRVGWDGKQHYYSGDSMVIGPLGETILDLKDVAQVGQITLDDTELENVRHDLPFNRDADAFDFKS